MSDVLNTPSTDQPGLVAMLADPEGETLVARIHERKRLTAALEAADAVYTSAVQAAVAKAGDWASVQVAGERVRECRAALKVTFE
jgi:hypothetical protein